MENPLLHRVFRQLNRFFMVPAFRLGFGPFMGSPFTGYIMVLKTIGRKTGAVRYTPLNYAIMNGSVYCLPGWGPTAEWYRNLRARPSIEVLLPSGALAGVAEDVTDPEESLRAVRQVLKNGGFAGFFLGFNPFTVPDEVLRERTSSLPVVRIRPTGVANGAADPGGWLWITLWLVTPAVIAVVWLLLR
jgi:deazaflavin-dependent oxidoreductase (nitroreductase family)